MELESLGAYINIAITESLEDRFMGSKELYVRFLKKLAQEHREEELTAAWQKKDWQELHRQAHNLKGVAANLGLMRLSEVFAKLVMELRKAEPDEEEIGNALNRSLREYLLVKSILSKLD